MKMNPVVHFEMPAKNKKRMADFYAKTFGWQAQDMGKEFGNYTVVMTTESTKKGPKKPGAINGGFYQRTKKDQHTTLVISVDDIKKAMQQVKKSGGKVIGGQKPGKPDNIPGVGLFVAFNDTEGNRIGMLQPTPRQ